MSYGEVISVVIFALWFVASLYNQFPTPDNWLKSHLNWLGLLPVWSFFAPIPGTKDFVLLRRYCLRGGELLGWSEVEVGGDRHWSNLLWNPRRRERKAVMDMVQGLLGDLDDQVPETIFLSPSYIALLTFVSSLSFPRGAESTQFVIMVRETSGTHLEPRPLFSSAMHPL
jgi:hypothetical protein